jgi:hypothetical protein
MTDVTVFFRDTDKWRAPDKEPELSNLISDMDIANLYDLSMCILNIRKKATEENRKTVYYNQTLERFMDEFTIMIATILEKKDITGYISYIAGGPRLELSVPMKYD